jgi:hypothetical protein
LSNGYFTTFNGFLIPEEQAKEDFYKLCTGQTKNANDIVKNRFISANIVLLIKQESPYIKKGFSFN